MAMGFWQYYGLVFLTAGRHSLDLAEAFLFAALIGVCVLVFTVPSVSVWLGVNGWQAAAIIIGAIIVIRVASSPFWIFSDLKQQVVAFKGQIAVLEDRLKPKFKLSFDPGMGCVVESPTAISGSDAALAQGGGSAHPSLMIRSLFARVRADAMTSATVHNCRARLTVIETKNDAGEFVRRDVHDP